MTRHSMKYKYIGALLKSLTLNGYEHLFEVVNFGASEDSRQNLKIRTDM